MPAKRRTAKRRLDPLAEAQAWACLFACGHDFFDDLAEWGFPHQDFSPDVAARAAAPEAWARLGRIFIDGDMGGLFNCGTAGSWALQEFGEPEKCQ